MRPVVEVEEYVNVRSPVLAMEDKVAAGGIELPLGVISVAAGHIESEVRIEAGQGVSEPRLVLDSYQDIDVVVPGDAAVVAQGPDEGSPGHEVRHVRPLDGLDERREGAVE